MLPGPVFNVELMTTARRARYYFIRVFYGLLLLYIVWQNYSSLRRYGPGEAEYSIREMSSFAMGTFWSFSTLQGLTILILTPALVAGVIADERQRKTLHYLLASRLSGGEIVIGKLAARLLHVGVFLAIGMPIMSLLSLFGGVDPRAIVAVYSGTASTALFLAGLAILMSTLTKRPRDAIVSTYLLELAWLALPPIVDTLIRNSTWWFWRQVYLVAGPINEWIYPTHPAYPFVDIAAASGKPTTLLERVAWMVGLQLAYGALFIVFAVWRLRPSFRNEGRHRWSRFSPFRFARGSRWRLFPRSSCGDDPMLWKERHIARFRGLTKFVAVLIGFCVFLGLCTGTWYFAPPAYAEVAAYGYGWVGISSDRQGFNIFLRVICAMLYSLCAIGVAATAASGLTSEREEDTWISLIASDLSGVEIIRAKMFGAVWGLRWMIGMMAALWLIGTICGAIHPFGVVAVAVELAVYLWFATALGTFISQKSRTTIRALGWTITSLLAFNGGYMLCCGFLPMNTQLILSGISPVIHGISLLSYNDVWQILDFGNSREESWFSEKEGGEAMAACVLSVVIYAVAALLLTVGVFQAHHRAVDRPDRSNQDRRPIKKSGFSDI